MLGGLPDEVKSFALSLSMKRMKTVTPLDCTLTSVKLGAALAIALLAENGLGYRAAHALTFSVQAQPGTPTSAVEAFNTATQLWSSILLDDVTVNLNITFGQLNPNVLGNTQPNEVSFNYGAVRNALIADATSSQDAIATRNLQSGSAFDLLINYTSDSPHGYGSSTAYLDNDGGSNNQKIRMTSANAKALGLGSNSSSDARIVFNSGINWDFDRHNGVAQNAYDFVGIAAHEIGHALGFISGVDLLDQYSPFQVNRQDFYFPENTFSAVSTLDLYRFSADSTAFGSSVIDWTAGNQPKYFSIDGGRTAIRGFSTGIFNGDGKSASHWKTGGGSGLMTPVIASGQRLSISNIDVTAFDVIGWDVERRNTRLATGLVSATLPLTLPSSRVNIEIADFETANLKTTQSVPEPDMDNGLALVVGLVGMGWVATHRCRAGRSPV